MIRKICPICDQKMKTAHYCANCKCWVKEPLTINVDYYLNERHPQNEHDCTYHDGADYAKPAAGYPAAGSNPSASAKKAPSSRPNPSAQTSSRNPERQTAQPGRAASGAGRKTQKPDVPFLSLAVVLIVSFLLMGGFLIIFFSLFL